MEKKNTHVINIIIILIFFVNIALWIINSLNIINIILLISVAIIDTSLCVCILVFIKRYADLSHEVSKDPLTRIYNRHYFSEAHEREIVRARRNEESMAMVIFDIDDFKKVNDNYGHYAGDQVLVGITQLVQHAIRQYDIFGRLGGEEFAILLPEINETKAIELCERIRYIIEKSRLNRKIPITISIGICMMDEYDDQHSMYQKADDAMYKAKKTGKNKVIMHQL